MSRTASCLFALGLCASLVAACGDDDGDGNGGGGTGGGGTGGTAGTAGRGGTGGGGTGGTAGTAGTGGAAGTAGTAGTGGTAGAAGTAGTGGTGGSGEVPDAGPDADVLSDAGADSGLNGNCPSFAAEAEGIEGAGNQTVVISRVEFSGSNARVTFRGVGDGTDPFDFEFMQLCSGDGACVVFPEEFEDALEPDEEVFVDFPNPVDVASGELAVTNPDESIVFAYIAWGEAQDSDLEDSASTGGFWTAGEFVEIDENNTIYGNGDATTADGYGVCTGDGDTLGG